MNLTFLPDVTVKPGSLKLTGKKAKQLGMNKPLVVTDPGLVRVGVAQQVVDVLTPVFGDTPVFDQCPENPSAEVAAAGLDFYLSRGCDGVVAVGGGSAMDAAKAIRILAAHGGDILDYDVTKGGVKKIGRNLPLMIAVPTTAGSGSEATLGTVITDSQNHVKILIFSPFLGAAAAILDPELTISLPPALTASTGMDAVVHGIEAYTAKGGNVVVRGICQTSFELIGKNLKKAVINGEDIEARTNMMTGAFLAGLAFANAGLGAVHAAAHQLGSRAGVPHGLANSLMLPALMKHNGPAVENDYLEICGMLNLTASTAEQAADALRDLAGELGLPTKLSDAGVDPGLFEQMAEDALLDPALRGNPVDVQKQDFIRLFQETL